MSDGKLFILAGTHQQASDYARENKIKTTDWCWLDSHYKIMGLRNLKIVRVGTFNKLKNIGEIERQICFEQMKRGEG